jgi:transposase
MIIAPCWRIARHKLEGLRTGDGRPLPPRLKAEIKRERQRPEPVLRMIAEVEAERNAIVEEAAPQHPNADKIKVLAGLSSIGPEFATRLVGEVFYRSFDNRRQLYRHRAESVVQWVDRARPGHQQV